MQQALRSRDTEAFSKLLAPDLRSECTIEQISRAIGEAEILPPGINVTGAYVDVDDPGRALARFKSREISSPGAVTEEFGVDFTWPMVKEGEEWRLDLPYKPAGRGCPFAFEEEDFETRVPGTQGMNELLLARLQAPPGATMLSGGGGYRNPTNGSYGGGAP